MMNIRYFIILLLIFIIFQIKAYDDKKCVEITNKKAIEYYNQALDKLKYFPKDAYDLLEKAIVEEPKYAEAYYILGSINHKKASKVYKDTSNVDKYEMYSRNSLVYFNKVIEFCPRLYHHTSYFFIGEHFYRAKQYEKAQEKLNYFLEKEHHLNDTTELEESHKMLKNIRMYFDLINNPVPFNPQLLDQICTEDDEFLPLITPDGEYFFYTHRYKKTFKTHTKEVEEFTFSRIIQENDNEHLMFTKGEIMPFPFNIDNRNQGGASITIDNKHIFITICDSEREKYTSYKNCDIYTADFVNGAWTKLHNLGTNINGIYTWEGQPSISANGKVLYFSSAREGGLGGLDIYRSVKDNDGIWSKAENLGETINTKGNDKTPFIHSDNQTLYFSSDGRFGLGSFDIFYSRLKDNNWSEPKNLGYPINTENDEVGFVVSRDGKKIYFSSNTLSEDKNDWEIYSSELHEEVKPKDVLFIKGQLFDEKGNPLSDVKVELSNLKTKEITSGMVDATGQYALAVGTDINNSEFIITVKKKGYVFDTEKYNINELKKGKVVYKNISLKPIKVGDKIRLKNIYFETNSHTLEEKSNVVLDNLLEFLNVNSKVRIALQGHTDNIGTNQDNLILSKKRAKVIYDFLVKNNIYKGRLSYEGFGEENPLETNDTSIGRAMNRRTEFTITKK